MPYQSCLRPFLPTNRCLRYVIFARSPFPGSRAGGVLAGHPDAGSINLTDSCKSLPGSGRRSSWRAVRIGAPVLHGVKKAIPSNLASSALKTETLHARNCEEFSIGSTTNAQKRAPTAYVDARGGEGLRLQIYTVPREPNTP